MALALVSTHPPAHVLHILENRDWVALEDMIRSGFPANACWGQHGSLFERFVAAASLPSPPLPHSPSHLAQMRVLEALIEAGLAPTRPPGRPDHALPLSMAAISGRADFVRRLLDDAHAPNGLGPSHHTPLSLLALRASTTLPAMNACFSSLRACAQELLDAGAEVNQPVARGWLPLTLAASVQDVDMVSLLLSKGALVNARAPGICKGPGPQYTAACWAIHHDNDRLLRVLLEHDASLTPSMTPGVGMVEMAGSKCGPDVWRTLVGRAGLDSDAVHRAWFRAVAENRSSLVLWFLCAGMSPAVKGDSGWRALDVACEHQALDVIPLLASAGAHPNRPAQDGLTPLGRLRAKGGRQALESVGWGIRQAV